MKLAIIGSRNLTNVSIDEEVDKLKPTTIVSGGAKGIDTLAEDYAIRHNLPLIVYKPEYDKYPGKKAPIMRNNQIVDEADYVLAFWDGESQGTIYTIRRAMKLGKGTKVIRVENPNEKQERQFKLF